MPSADVNGLRLYYERHGDNGDPLVFVHGYTGDISDWRLQIATFKGDYRVLVMDLRGHGRSDSPVERRSYTIDLMVSDVEEIVRLAGFDRFHLVGHSMGGAVAQEIALRSPQKLLSLTLEDSAPKFDLPVDDALFQFRAQRLNLAQTQGMAAAAALEPPWLPPHMPPERLRETDERLARMSVDAFVAAARALFDWQGATGRLPSIVAPTLVICGDLDAPSFVEASRRMTQLIPNASLEIIPE
ncbi:MAG: alpha/beta hydrolase, partial [Acidobacteria bacterium]|nr:alpha/beta hydrolase [Acidobacteriota bacterium]